MYIIVLFLGLLILLNSGFILLQIVQGKKEKLIPLFINIGFGLLFLLDPELPTSIVVIAFGLYVCITGVSHFITYIYYRKENVSGRLAFLISSLVLVFVAITFIISPLIHAQQMTIICAIYMLYLGIKFMTRSMRELLSEDRKNSLKRRIRVSLPIFMEALAPRMVLEFVNERLEQKDDTIYPQDIPSPLYVFVHVSKQGFGAIGHVDLCYDGEVIAYGAYDDASNHLMGALGDGVLFTMNDKEAYLDFCLQDDPTSAIFEYNLYLDDVQKQRVQETIESFKKRLIPWQPPYLENKEADDYASRLYKRAHASFYKFKKGQFKYYFVMTTNCVLLADHIIGKSGIDIINMNGIITPGTYYTYLEEESLKENSRVLKKEIYIKDPVLSKNQ